MVWGGPVSRVARWGCRRSTVAAVVPGGHGPELLAPVHQPFDAVALPAAVRAKVGGRPPRDPFRARWALVVFSGMSCWMIGPAVPGGCCVSCRPCPWRGNRGVCGGGRSGRGGPRPRRRAAGPVGGCRGPGPGSGGWSGSGPARPRSCGSSWSTRRATCRILPVAPRHGCLAPFTRAGGVLVGAHDRGIGVAVPVQVSGSPPRCSIASIRAQVPSSCQRVNRLYSVFHGPYRAGTSRHGTPVRTRNTIPLITCR